MQYGVCCVPVSSIRKEPSHKSEIITQALFGEYFEVESTNEDNWMLVTQSYDGYKGWIMEGHIDCDINNESRDENFLTESMLTTIIYDNKPMYLPLGSNLNVPTCFIEKHQIKFEGDSINSNTFHPNKASIISISSLYLNTAYLWGGKSNFGIDCSGFTQMIYKFLNVPIFRDAHQQATQGEEVKLLSEAICGDLAFFVNNEERITHVGILLDANRIIHSSGKVRIDTIDEKGIINNEKGIRTHTLKLIKRYFNQ